MDKIVSDPFITVRRENLVAHLKPTFGHEGMGTYVRVDPDVVIVDLPTP
jgi:hypothetical protein